MFRAGLHPHLVRWIMCFAGSCRLPCQFLSAKSIRPPPYSTAAFFSQNERLLSSKYSCYLIMFCAMSWYPCWYLAEASPLFLYKTAQTIRFCQCCDQRVDGAHTAVARCRLWSSGRVGQVEQSVVCWSSAIAAIIDATAVATAILLIPCAGLAPPPCAWSVPSVHSVLVIVYLLDD